jgi:hypothetical protein
MLLDLFLEYMPRFFTLPSPPPPETQPGETAALIAVQSLITTIEGGYPLPPQAVYNPLLFMGDYLKPPTPVSTEGISVLAFSGGKESQLAKLVLDTLDVKYVSVNIFDKWQAAPGEEPTEDSILLHEVRPYSTYSHPVATRFGNSPDLHASELGEYTLKHHFNIVPLQRLIVALYAELNYPGATVYFGDEADVHQIFNVRGSMFFPHTFYQTQWFYNIVESLTGVKLRSPVSNFNQVHIVKLLAERGIEFKSCWKKRDGWCGECEKCLRIASLFNSLGMQAPFLVDWPQWYEPQLGNFNPPNSAEFQEVYAPFRGHLDPQKVSLVDDPLINVWSKEQLEVLRNAFAHHE